MNKLDLIGTEVELKIEKIVPQGLGLGFAEKMTFFVPLAARGDVLKVKINHIKGKIAFADITEIVTPSPDRTTPKCPYFGVCGGCNFQHLNYPAQLAAKVEILEDCLRRIGKIRLDAAAEIIGSPREYAYRARAAWHADTRTKNIGYYRRYSGDVIDVETCPILVGELQELLTEVRETIEWDSFLNKMIEIEAAASSGKVSIYSDEIIEPTEEILCRAYGETYIYSAKGFFQGNSSLVEKLIETAVGGAEGGRALDLYCGVGLFTLPLARRFGRVTGVEGSRAAAEHARRNVENARLENVKIADQGVGEWLSESAGKIKDCDFVLLDPPRTGAEKGVIESVLKINPREISYVSCDPSVLARDLRMLLDGGYHIEKMTALDLFPQTHHVETVVRLRR